VNANRELWEMGDFGRIAASMRASGEALVDGLGVEAGMDVLDLGCGEGTTALPAAERGADVLGVDIAANLAAAGQARAAAAGLDNVKIAAAYPPPPPTAARACCRPSSTPSSSIRTAPRTEVPKSRRPSCW
jgi:SAM-dependent methyltransferase